MVSRMSIVLLSLLVATGTDECFAAAGQESVAQSATHSAGPDSKDAFSAVDPFIGTEGGGHTFPGATLPFGMVQLSPDTQTRYYRQTVTFRATSELRNEVERERL